MSFLLHDPQITVVVERVFHLTLDVFKGHVINCFVFHRKRIRLMDYSSGGLVFKRSQILRLPCIILANN